MYYKTSGKGKAIVLLHGFIEEGNMWNEIAKSLSKKYQVIVPDLEGFGNTPFTGKQLSMEKYAKDVFEMLQKEKIKRCIMLGHSMGGYVTLHFAEKYPELLSGFGLVNSHCFEDAPEKKLNRKKGNEFIAKHGSHIFVKELYNTIFHDAFKKKGQKLIDGLIEQASNYTPEALIAANTAMMKRKGKEEVLKNAQVPVLLIGGKQDPAAPLDLFLKQASMPPVTDFHLFDKTKHMSLFEKKKETLSAIENFVKHYS
jgi:pimeloyl-ACP methyl ester carboxylesterase